MAVNIDVSTVRASAGIGDLSTANLLTNSAARC